MGTFKIFGERLKISFENESDLRTLYKMCLEQNISYEEICLGSEKRYFTFPKIFLWKYLRRRL